MCVCVPTDGDNDTHTPQAQAGLRTLAQGDPSAEARQLADQLLSVAFAFSPPAPTPTRP
jgi:hypothetical protein